MPGARLRCVNYQHRLCGRDTKRTSQSSGQNYCVTAVPFIVSRRVFIKGTQMCLQAYVLLCLVSFCQLTKANGYMTRNELSFQLYQLAIQCCVITGYWPWPIYVYSLRLFSNVW